MKKIGIITALSAEAKQLEAIFQKPLKTDLYGNISVKTYAYNGKEIYFAKSGVGEIFAAACTQILVSVYGVEVVVNYGLAGSDYHHKTGDSVLIKGVVHYDMDTSKVDGAEPGRYSELYDTPLIETDERLLNFAKTLKLGTTDALLASGDKFVADENFKANLYESYKTSVYDMEGAAVLLICKNAAIPALIIKVISDSGSKDEYYSFKQLLSDTKIKFVGDVKTIVDNL